MLLISWEPVSVLWLIYHFFATRKIEFPKWFPLRKAKLFTGSQSTLQSLARQRIVDVFQPHLLCLANVYFNQDSSDLFVSSQLPFSTFRKWTSLFNIRIGFQAKTTTAALPQDEHSVYGWYTVSTTDQFLIEFFTIRHFCKIIWQI